MASGLGLKIENCDAVRRTSLSLFVGIGGVVRTNPLAGTIGVTGWHKVPNPRALSVALELSKRFLLLTKVIYYRSVWLRVNTYPIILLYLSVALGLSKRAGFLCHPIVFTLKISWSIHTRTKTWSLKSREVFDSISDHFRYVTYQRCLQLYSFQSHNNNQARFEA